MCLMSKKEFSSRGNGSIGTSVCEWRRIEVQQGVSHTGSALLKAAVNSHWPAIRERAAFLMIHWTTQTPCSSHSDFTEMSLTSHMWNLQYPEPQCITEGTRLRDTPPGQELNVSPCEPQIPQWGIWPCMISSNILESWQWSCIVPNLEVSKYYNMMSLAKKKKKIKMVKSSSGSQSS